VLIHVAATDVAVADAIADAVGPELPNGDELSGPDVAGRMVVKSSDPRGTLTALEPLRRRWSGDGLRVVVDVDPVPALDRSS
jgi:hypothetical protein